LPRLGATKAQRRWLNPQVTLAGKCLRNVATSEAIASISASNELVQ